MRQIADEGGVLRFTGSLCSEGDLEAASGISTRCPSYRIDEEDEDYLEGARSCFNCRYRRWIAGGFSCVRAFPPLASGRG